MITLLGLHDKCPVLLAEIIKWITSSTRHARRVNVYNLARKYQMNIVDLRLILDPFVKGGLIHFVGAGKKYFNKIEVDDKLELFWREWVLPALAPCSFDYDLNKMYQRTLHDILGDNILKPYCKGMTRKPKDQVVLCLFNEIFKSKETFVLYQNRCMETLTTSQLEILKIVSKNPVDLNKLIELCDCDEEQLIEAITILREKLLIRVIWLEEDDIMRWKLMPFSYEQFVVHIPCHEHKNINIIDNSMYRMLELYKDDNHKLSNGKETLLLWEYYFISMEKEWTCSYNAGFCFFKHFMEFWYTIFDKNLTNYENIDTITSGLFIDNYKKIHVLVLLDSLKQYLKFAIKWGLLYKNDKGIMMTTLGVTYVNGMDSQARMIWGRNTNQLTIVLSVDHKWFVSGWLDLIAQKTDDGNYLINPEILRVRQITRHQLLFILGSMFQLSSRQKERITTWIS
ncbi:MAG: hypothetical protein WA125_00355 [Desulfosporosinus sp.]